MSNTPQTEPISDFMERHFAHLRHGRKEYTEAEVRSIMLAFEAGLSHLVAENSDLRERNAAMGNAQEIALDTATEHALAADELRGALATAEAERDQLRAQVERLQGGEPVTLTDEEIEELQWRVPAARNSTADDLQIRTTRQMTLFARAIEAALREKEGGV